MYQSRASLKSRWILASTFVAGSGALAFFLYRYGEGALDLLGREFSPGLLAAFFAMGAATLGCLSWRWRFLLGALACPPSLGVMALYRSAAHGFAVLIPSGKVGGDPFRIWLAVRGKVAAGAAIASVAVDRTLEIAATAPFSMIFAAILLQQGVPRVAEAMTVVAVATVGLLLGIGFAVRRLRRGSGLVTALVANTKMDRFEFVGSRVQVLEESEYGAKRLSEDSVRLRAGFAAGLLANGLVIGEFALLLAAFGLPSDPVAVVAALFATGAAHLLPVPGGVGVLEGAQVWIFTILGYPVEVGLAVGLVARLRELLWMLPGLVYASVLWHTRIPVQMRGSPAR